MQEQAPVDQTGHPNTLHWTLVQMLHYNICCLPHHHDPDDMHPSPAVAPLLLRMSAWERVAAALAVAAILWIAVWWAVT
jgi:hypothetical protein